MALTIETRGALLKTWPAQESVLDQGWQLQANQGFTKRANSALAVESDADPQVVVDFHRRRSLVPMIQEFVGREPARRSTLPAWDALEPDPVLLARADAVAGVDAPQACLQVIDVEHAGAASDHAEAEPNSWFRAWFASGRADSPVARATVVGSPRQALIWAPDPHRPEDRLPLALGRVAFADGIAGVNCMWTRADHRGQGYALAILRAMALWVSGVGAESMILSVEAGNHSALRSYAKAGFEVHDHYRYRMLRSAPG